MKHTQGPWEVHYHSHINKELWLSILKGAWDITHNGASNPAVVACSKYSAMGEEENLANAYLIAAAPDLLEACKFAFENLKPQGNIKKDFSGHNAIATLSRAITKAEGKR